MKSPPDKLGLTVLARNNFDGLEYLHILQGKNEIIDEVYQEEELTTSFIIEPGAGFNDLVGDADDIQMSVK
jgi:hypothetical protein